MAEPGIPQFSLESCQIFFHEPNSYHTFKLEPIVVLAVAMSNVVIKVSTQVTETFLCNTLGTISHTVTSLL